MDFRNVNRKAFESLAYSGGFDSFGLYREQYFAPCGKEGSFLDAIVRYGQRFQASKAEAATSLFGADDVEIAHPQPSKPERWNSLERLNKERELVGIYLSAHPLDDYEVALKHLCNTQCIDIRGRDTDMEPLSKLQEITFGGIITESTERFSNYSGKPFGIIQIEDYSGTGELSIFDAEWPKWNGMLKKEYLVRITAKCVERYRGSGKFQLNIVNVEFLVDVKNRGITSMTIGIDCDKFDEQLEDNLATKLNDNLGQTPLLIRFYNCMDQRGEIVMRSAKSVNVTRKLLDFLDEYHFSYQFNI